MGSQQAKTDGILDLIGHRLDQRPTPILYVGPTRDFVTDQFEPRLVQLIEQAPRLAAKMASRSRMKKTRKIVAGVSVRLAHGGSSAALKSDPAGLAFVDEYDELLANVKGQGDPLGLVNARGFTYADFVTVIASTPSQGFVETETDPVARLDFWKLADPDDLASPIWKLYQEGTRHHWAWPCLQCGDYFIPRFRDLAPPPHATPAQARRETVMRCPHCGGVAEYGRHFKAMNERGRFVAPGQTIDQDGNVEGAPPDSSTASYWVSGLASPFVTWGERMETYLRAVVSGEDDKIQTAINAGGGECFSHGTRGDVPEWQEVMDKRVPYALRTVPRDVIRVTMGVDVQKNSLIYVTRGWGWRGSSWLLDYGQLYGPTSEDEVWNELENIMLTPIDGMMIERAFVDSGFRPNKSDEGDEHRVYEFCRRLSWIAYPTKGHDTQAAPTRQVQIDVNKKGQRARYSISLVHLNSDHWKSFVHSAVRLPVGAARSFHVPMGDKDQAGFIAGGITEDYARQIVSEARTRNPANGKAVWVRRSRENHLLDCESMAAAAAYQLGVQTIPEGAMRPEAAEHAGGPPGAAYSDANDDPYPAVAVDGEPQPVARQAAVPPATAATLRQRFGGMAARLNR